MGLASFMKAGTSSLVFSTNPVYPGKTTIHSGTVTGQTEGGVEYVYDKSDPYLMFELRFEDLPASDFDGGFNYLTKSQVAGTQSLVNWFINVFSSDRQPFTYNDPFGNEHLVIISGDRLDFSLSDYGLYNGTIVLKEKIG